MAEFELDRQRSGVIPGAGRFETGYVDFSGSSDTVEVATNFSQYWAGFGIADTTEANYSLVATTDGEISNSNITFKRHGDNISGDARFRYVMFGW